MFVLGRLGVRPPAAERAITVEFSGGMAPIVHKQFFG